MSCPHFCLPVSNKLSLQQYTSLWAVPVPIQVDKYLYCFFVFFFISEKQIFFVVILLMSRLMIEPIPKPLMGEIVIL